MLDAVASAAEELGELCKIWIAMVDAHDRAIGLDPLALRAQAKVVEDDDHHWQLLSHHRLNVAELQHEIAVSYACDHGLAWALELCAECRAQRAPHCAESGRHQVIARRLHRQHETEEAVIARAVDEQRVGG